MTYCTCIEVLIRPIIVISILKKHGQSLQLTLSNIGLTIEPSLSAPGLLAQRVGGKYIFLSLK